MTYLSRIWKRIWKGKPVSASNAARARKTENSEGDFSAPAIPLSDELASSRAGIERVLSELNTDDDSLIRADLRLSLLRMFKLLNDGSAQYEMKDLTACVQRLSALMKRDDTTAQNGVSDEALADLERDVGLV